MSIRCVGIEHGKYQIQESDPKIILGFIGPEADKFEQVDPPAIGELVEFSLPEAFCVRGGLIPLKWYLLRNGLVTPRRSPKPQKRRR